MCDFPSTDIRTGNFPVSIVIALICPYLADGFFLATTFWTKTKASRHKRQYALTGKKEKEKRLMNEVTATAHTFFVFFNEAVCK